jgi:hypothetical protein
VTLEELRTCLVEDLDLVLDSPGRPATFDVNRVSRDPEHWTALATYGHPALEPALTKLAATSGTDRSALVLRELGHLAAAYRADRTPPAPVRQLSDLFDLSDAVSAGEAEQLAAVDLKLAAELIRRQDQELAGARRERWERQIRRRFRQLVVQTLNAESVARIRRDGEVPDPQLVWMDLIQDTKYGWANADPFRLWLDLELASLLPRGGPAVDNRSDRELAKVRVDAAKELVALIQEWMAVAKPESET